jgi:hypothetical protein
LEPAILLALLGSFAVLLTVHVALVAGLVRKSPRWRGPVALFVPPLALYWGMHERMRLRSALWLTSLAVYIVSRIIAEI